MRGAVVVAGVVLSACIGKPVEEQGAGLSISVSNVRIMGSLEYGAQVTSTSRSGRKYRAWELQGTAGDEVDLRVSSRHGDPVAYVCDADLKILARNDDATDEGAAFPTDSHVTIKLPATGPYLIVVKDYHGEVRRFSVDLRAVPASGPDPVWEAAAQAEVTRLASEFTPLEAFAVELSAMPPAAQARYDASIAVLEVPHTYRLEVEGRPVYLVLATDGSGEGNTVVVDLIDGAGRWFAHGIAHTFWDSADSSFFWALDEEDATVCLCPVPGAAEAALCTWIDGSTAVSTMLSCE
jgi:hypothetical protein